MKKAIYFTIRAIAYSLIMFADWRIWLGVLLLDIIIREEYEGGKK